MHSTHQPVLYHEIIHALQPKSGGRYVDGTLGAGGHAAGLLIASEPEGLLLGLDVDAEALSIARQNLSHFGRRVWIKKASYTSLPSQLAELGWDKVDGILLDLGTSSMQFESAQRGFSFLLNGPVDMRFDLSSSLSASEIVNTWPEDELSSILFRYGEESASRQIARAIVASRPISGTKQLAEIIEHVLPRYRTHHPATRTFQALRIAVNGELGSIEMVLPLAIDALREGGRLAVISFHSLEDRLVKNYIRLESKDCICPPKQPICTCGHQATIKEITRRPITPTESELKRNLRARSAKLRVAEKL